MVVNESGSEEGSDEGSDRISDDVDGYEIIGDSDG